MLILISLFGLVIGSFLNAVIYRLKTGEKITEKSSRCPNCRHELSWLDLIPLVSFFWLKGRCRYCKKPISWQYPLVELATAIAFILIYIKSAIPAKVGIQFWILGLDPRMMDYLELVFQFVFASFLIIIFVYDLKHYLILDRVVWPAAVLALLYELLTGRFLAAILGAALLAGFFCLLYAISRGRWIGFGDVKLAIFLGFLVPYPQVLVLFFLAYFLGAVVSGILLVLKLKGLRDAVPFGVFLTPAAFVAMLWGQTLVQWYFRLIGIA